MSWLLAGSVACFGWTVYADWVSFYYGRSPGPVEGILGGGRGKIVCLLRFGKEKFANRGQIDRLMLPSSMFSIRRGPSVVGSWLSQ